MNIIVMFHDPDWDHASGALNRAMETVDARPIGHDFWFVTAPCGADRVVVYYDRTPRGEDRSAFVELLAAGAQATLIALHHKGTEQGFPRVYLDQQTWLQQIAPAGMSRITATYHHEPWDVLYTEVVRMLTSRTSLQIQSVAPAFNKVERDEWDKIRHNVARSFATLHLKAGLAAEAKPDDANRLYEEIERQLDGAVRGAREEARRFVRQRVEIAQDIERLVVTIVPDPPKRGADLIVWLREMLSHLEGLEKDPRWRAHATDF